MKVFPKKPYARIHLPALTAEEALLISSIFDKARAAIWRAHGREMYAFLYGDHECQVEEQVDLEESFESEQVGEADKDDPSVLKNCEFPF